MFSMLSNMKRSPQPLIVLTAFILVLYCVQVQCFKSLLMFCGKSDSLDHRCYHIFPVDSCTAQISSPLEFQVKYVCGRGSYATYHGGHDAVEIIVLNNTCIENEKFNSMSAIALSGLEDFTTSRIVLTSTKKLACVFSSTGRNLISVNDSILHYFGHECPFVRMTVGNYNPNLVIKLGHYKYKNRAHLETPNVIMEEVPIRCVKGSHSYCKTNRCNFKIDQSTPEIRKQSAKYESDWSEGKNCGDNDEIRKNYLDLKLKKTEVHMKSNSVLKLLWLSMVVFHEHTGSSIITTELTKEAFAKFYLLMASEETKCLNSDSFQRIEILLRQCAANTTLHVENKNKAICFKDKTTLNGDAFTPKMPKNLKFNEDYNDPLIDLVFKEFYYTYERCFVHFREDFNSYHLYETHIEKVFRTDTIQCRWYKTPGKNDDNLLRYPKLTQRIHTLDRFIEETHTPRLSWLKKPNTGANIDAANNIRIEGQKYKIYKAKFDTVSENQKPPMQIRNYIAPDSKVLQCYDSCSYTPTHGLSFKKGKSNSAGECQMTLEGNRVSLLHSGGGEHNE